jgi:hypothetical protein
MTEFEVIRKDAIRLATVVVNLSKKYKPFQARVRGLGFRALSTRQLWELEHVCRELRTVYCKLLELECDHATPQGERPISIRGSGTDRGRDMDNPDLGLEP